MSATWMKEKQRKGKRERVFVQAQKGSYFFFLYPKFLTTPPIFFKMPISVFIKI